MWLKILLGIIAILGILLMWFSVFGKKKAIDNMSMGGSFSLFELIFDLLIEFSPTLVKRILLFILGLAIAFVFTIYS
ncbi:hypothetical protein B4U37_12020 [Sutcliffiella horikoshii]|uniref:Uncharacterized protein n=1 Tax=Sutcliffiella horikoshii TaxID=79883 RepID=A0ABM6KK28_9BACI|nr:hypothetical protein [Sutcliffiella horikoshii]ART76722.1 hypothetical protein B4U37_12020 [Sutcliffiella horikoshii]